MDRFLGMFGIGKETKKKKSSDAAEELDLAEVNPRKSKGRETTVLDAMFSDINPHIKTGKQPRRLLDQSEPKMEDST